MVYQKGEKVVYPGHGVAIVHDIQVKLINGQKEEFYELKFVGKDITVLVPTGQSESVGLRRLSSNNSVACVYELLSKPYVAVQQDGAMVNWNKRNKKYMGSIRTGDLKEVGAIYHYLRHSEKKKELSFGEKKVLEETEKMLAEEIAIVENMAQEAAIARVRSLIR